MMDALELAKRATSPKTAEYYARVLREHDARFPRVKRTMKRASKRGGRPLPTQIGPRGFGVSPLYAGKSWPE